MKKKWFRTMDLVDDAFIEEADPSRQVTPLRKKRMITTLVATAACLAITLTGLWFFLPRQDTGPVIDKHPPSIEEENKNPYQAIIDKLSPLKSDESDVSMRDDVLIDSVTPDAMAPTGAPTDGIAPPISSRPDGSASNNGTTSDNGSTYEEITDNQVEGIIEADRIKRSSTHIFYLDGNTLKIFNIAGMDSAMVGSVSLDDTYQYYRNQWDFYLSADCKTVTVLARYENADDRLCVGVVSIDVSDPTNPTVKNKVEITGDYLSSRMTDGKLLLMTELRLNAAKMDFEKEETFLPQINGKSIPCDCIILPEEVNSARYTVVLKLDEDTLKIEGQSASLSYSEQIYVSKDHIFLTYAYTDKKAEDGGTTKNTMTDITALSYKDAFEKKGTVPVRGYVKDQWSMDEYEGVLRVVTTTDTTFYGDPNVSVESSMFGIRSVNASLYCIDLKEYKVVASVEDFAPDGENVRSVRFDKNTAYVCTAIQVTDPVYFFDLSDLNNITYKETGNIDGFSTSLINIGNGYLLGIGQENWNTFKVEVYEETETGVVGVCEYTRNKITYSENYKSYLVDRENQLIGLGIHNNGNGEMNGSRYILLHFNGYTLEEVVDVKLPGSNDMKRGVYIDGFLYLFGSNAFRVVDVKTGETNDGPRKIQTIYDVAKLDNIPCDTAMELFWEDRENSYYFSCIKSQYIKVVYKDGTSEDIVTALKAGNATIRDLDQFEIEYYVKPKET